ncbi:hypothetical protein FACS189472_06330 [Alphaproteobacteria bacterium]|nr:hypothetical protein FACS189472_06330 [Alphaproteobacteria bacterium]
MNIFSISEMEVSQYSQWQLRQLTKEDLIAFAAWKLQCVIDRPDAYINEYDESRIQRVIDVLKESSGIGSVTTLPVEDLISGVVQLDESKVYIIRRR